MILFITSLSKDEEEFLSEIYNKYYKEFYQIALNKLRNTYDAEDALSNTFQKIINNIEKINKLKCPKIKPYCVIILRNECINIFRKNKKYLLEEDIEKFQSSSDLEDDILWLLEKRELYKILDKLSEEEKNFIYLRYFHEKNYKEISKALNISTEAAYKRNQRLLLKIKNIYEGDEKNG